MATILRLFVDHPLSAETQITLDQNQAHYLNNVMRLSLGDEVHVFNGQDGEWSGELTEAHKKKACLRLQHQIRGQLDEPDVVLAFAPIKKQRLDFLIEKATELGVSRLIPVMTRRTNSARVRYDRLCAQVIEASEQCERLNIPHLEDAVDLPGLIKNWPDDRKLFVMNERGGAQPILTALQDHKSSKAAFLVGPEGGFDPSELDLLEKLPFVVPISAGPRILRAETAALSALSCWQSVCGDWLEPLRTRFED